MTYNCQPQTWVNMRPSRGNRSRGVESEEVRRKIIGVVKEKIGR